MDIGSIIGAGRPAVFAAAGSAARSVQQLNAPNAMQQPSPAPASSSAALAAGMIAFAAVGLLVAFRFAFKGAVS